MEAEQSVERDMETKQAVSRKVKVGGNCRTFLYSRSYANAHKDSTMGKIMEKAGHVMHNEGLAEKGRAKRETSGFGQAE